uniref:Uncharacterized protein n=1 Tax=viral metagenome TaxID=1070528 RepID=A0A6M3JHW5_9ZZZZ
MNKTSKKDFDFFVAETSYWLVRLNLQDYGVVFVHMELESEKTQAWVEVSLKDKIATFGLSVDWDWMTPSNYYLSKSAFHECCELMLYKLHDSLTKFYSYKYVNEMRHEVIRTLESVLFEPYWNEKEKKRKRK